MANNCLKTQLKSVVNNDTLMKIGQISWDVIPVDSFAEINSKISFTFSGNFEIVAKNGAYFTTTSFADLSDESERKTSYEGEAGTVTLWIGNSAGSILIRSKYDITNVTGGDNITYTHVLNINLDDLEYSDALSYLKANNAVGNMDVLAGKSLTTINLRNAKGIYSSNLDFVTGSLTNIRLGGVITGVKGNISSLAQCTSIVALQVLGSQVEGDVSVLGGLAQLNQINIRNTSITGTVESFVNARNNAGVTNGDCSCSGLLNNCTFGGERITAPSQTQFIEWNGTTKINVYSGGSSIDNAPTVYAKGATAEEITALKTAGKTVYAYENGEWVIK